MAEMEWTFTLAAIEKTAEAFWAAVGGFTVFAFHGQMGAGKTTFIHYLCMARGVKDTVGSPTFALVNEYQSAGPIVETIYHIDLYRLEDEAEAIRAGMEEYLFSGAICMVEWPEKAPGIFPLQTVHVYINVMDATRRWIKIEFPAGN